MIFDESRPVEFQDALPDAVDVVVIGGGVAGICAAYYLAKAGVSVLVCEKGRVAGEQSSRNWGWVRQQGRDPDELPLVTEAIRLWEDIAQDVDVDIGFKRTGVLYCANTPEQLAEYEKWQKFAEEQQLDTRMITADEVDNLLGGAPGKTVGGMLTASDAKAEPFKSVPAIARALQKHGGLVRENCAVRTLVTQGGEVSGVVTEEGEVKAQSVVCAGGAWTTRFLGNLNIWLPQLTVRGTVVRTAPAPEFYSGAAMTGHLGIRRRQDGGYTLATGKTHEHYISRDSVRDLASFLPVLRSGAMAVQLRLNDGLWSRLRAAKHWRADEVSPFEKQRVLNPLPSKRAVRQIQADTRTYFPALADVPIAQAWAGMIDTTPDVVPVMDEAPGIKNCYISTGYSGHGFGIGPGAGKAMADMVMGNPIPHDLSRFRYARFTDGSKMQPGPGI